MAKKAVSKLNAQKKTKQGKNANTYQFIMAMVVIVTMLISGLYFLGSGDGGTGTTVPEENISFNSYGMNQIALNSSITVTADQPLMELVAIPKAQCVSTQAIGWVYNTTAPGIRSVMLDAVNPGKDSAGNLCGTFLFFKFAYSAIDESTIAALNNELVNRLGDYTLKRSYVGILPVNLSGPGTDRIYVIGSTDIAKGDDAEILMFQKTSDGSVFALERNRIAEGPRVSATVLDLTDIMVQGTVAGNYELENIEKRINVSNSRLTPAAFAVNGTLDNETVKEISAIPDASVEKTENQTRITYNASMDEVKSVLDGKNITYSAEDGSVILQIPLNTSVSSIQSAVKAGGITEAEIKMVGFVKVPELVRINGQIVTVENSDRFNAVLNIDAEAGDRVNITLSTMQFGDQVFVLGGSEE
ncbi:MAG: hypothetical protein WAX07_06975 [Candidatus Altiarchaeia archaeon]